MDSLLQTCEADWKVGLIFVMLCFLAAGKELPCQSFYHMKIV